MKHQNHIPRGVCQYLVSKSLFERPTEVLVNASTKRVLSKQKYTGLMATCIQHEIDHLNGKLFIDYLSPLKRQLIRKQIKKINQNNGALLKIFAGTPVFLYHLAKILDNGEHDIMEFIHNLIVHRVEESGNCRAQ